MIKSVAKMISRGKAIGWFSGENGIWTKSAGSRSILADQQAIK